MSGVVVDVCTTVVVNVLWLLELTGVVTPVGDNCSRGPVSTAEVGAEVVVYVDTMLPRGVELVVGVLSDEELVVIGKLEVMFCST